MAVGDLRKLWQLHLIDSQLHNVRARAAALDPGRAIQARIAALQSELDKAAEEYGVLHREQTDLELEQKSIDAKIAKFDKDLYSGVVVNPKEVENIQKEIEMLKRRKSQIDDRLFEIFDLTPPALAEKERAEANLQAAKAELGQHQKSVMAEKSRLEAAYKELLAKRPEVLKEVPPGLLPRYDQTLKKHGTAMALITKDQTCEVCGMRQAEKTVEYVKEDRIVTCEACARILYFSPTGI